MVRTAPTALPAVLLVVMKSEDRAQMEALCAQIAVEKDNHKFSELIQQLIDLLDRSRRAGGVDSSSPSLDLFPVKGFPKRGSRPE